MLASTTLASAQTATPVPDMKPDFSSMNFLLGTWSCKTTQNDTGRGTGRTETDTNTMVLDGHYMRTDSVSHPFDAARTRDVVNVGWLGYDSVTKNWYTFGVSNFGGFGMSTSPGWTSNTMVWTDTYNSDGQPLTVTTITKVSDTQNTSTNVYTAGGVKHSTSDSCTKNT
jgi:hypothetical protein